MAAYFDHNATTPLDPRVLQAMLPYMQQATNASSRHSFGRHARQAVESAREQVALAVGAHPTQVLFTSGGTEADNLAIQGLAAALKPSPALNQIVVSAVEHPAVMKTAQMLRRQGWQLRVAAVDANGLLDMDDFRIALQTPTALISVMLANNETGVIQDVATLAGLAKSQKIPFHTDAVQCLGKMALDFASLNAGGVQAMSLSAHKIGGPQGMGALVFDKRLDIRPLQYGGGQEKGLRGGSENVAAIVGFGAACELLGLDKQGSANTGSNSAENIKELRVTLEAGIHALGGVIFGEHGPRLNNTSFFAFPEVDGETLVMALDRANFAVASGSACSSDSTDPSPVLLAMGVDAKLAQGAVRVSLGKGNSMQEVLEFLQVLQGQLVRMKQFMAMAA